MTLRIKFTKKFTHLTAGVAAICGVLSGGVAAVAHDFWIEPEAYMISEPDTVKLAFRIGHGDEPRPWGLSWERIVGLKAYSQDAVQDLQSTIMPQTYGRPGQARVALTAEGTHVVAFESHHSLSELEAERFNAYADKAGLEAIIAHRLVARSADKPGRELYSRRSKALIQVGDTPTDAVLVPIGHTLEIVPELNPYTLSEGESLPVKLLFRGRPLAGALIEFTELGKGPDTAVKVRTDAAGKAVFMIPHTGMWRLNVIWGVPIPYSDDVEYETVFASLTFGMREK